MAKKQFVGHWMFHDDGAGRLAVSFSSTWKDSLLTKKEAEELVRQGMTDEWAQKMSEEIADKGSSLLHFYVTVEKSGEKKVSIDDCAEGCPSASQVRALLAPTKGRG